jgi:hypothetical protein
MKVCIGQQHNNITSIPSVPDPDPGPGPKK